MDKYDKHDQYVWHGFHNQIVCRMWDTIYERRADILRMKPDYEVYTRLRRLRLVKGELPPFTRGICNHVYLEHSMDRYSLNKLRQMHRRQCGCSMTIHKDALQMAPILHSWMKFPSPRVGMLQYYCLVPFLRFGFWIARKWRQLCSK